MAILIDTNILVYAHDPRDPVKQQLAEQTLIDGRRNDELIVPHQAIVEFVAATTRPRKDLGGAPLLELEEALVEAEDLLVHFPVVYPDQSVLRTAVRGAVAYGLSWYDAHLWAHAEVFGIPEILSEDFEHGRYYGGVRVRNPFLTGVHELPEQYATRAPPAV